MKKVVIVGGVAAGASCAARLRRLDAEAEIILLERGEYISYANCGLPYHVGDVIKSRDALLVTKAEQMRERFRVDVRVKNEVLSIHREEKYLRVMNHETQQEYTESYDVLLLATGSSPVRPSIPGIDSARIRTLWTVPDTDQIRKMLFAEEFCGKRPGRAVVVGGGFIGLEMAENLHAAGLSVSIVEAADQLMAPLDPEMALLLNEHIQENGVSLFLQDGVAAFQDKGEEVEVKLNSGKTLSAELVILAIGVKPNSRLAGEAGLPLNARGGILVDEHLRTEDPSIYAAGDVIEVTDFVSGQKTMVPLAGPANKQGRIAADNIAGGSSVYAGTQGSSVAKVFALTAASTGANEKTLLRQGLKKDRDFKSVILTQNSHAGYYPGALPMILKLLFTADGKRILGAQIVGGEGVDKRIDTLGTALRLGAGIHALTELELAYAPPYSSAKDPVNMAGFTAENVLKGLLALSEWNAPELYPEAVLLDVREEAELLAYSVPNAVNIPLGQLRDRLSSLDPEKQYIIFCAVGVRAYNAARILMQAGFRKVSVYPAGVRFYRSTHPESSASAGLKKCCSCEAESESAASAASSGNASPLPAQANREPRCISVDCCGLQCPGPIMAVFNAMKELSDGDLLRVTASDPGFAKDILSWCKRTGNELVSNERQGNSCLAVLRKGCSPEVSPSAQASPAFSQPSFTGRICDTAAPGGSRSISPDVVHGHGSTAAAELPQGKTIIVFDGDMDKVLASFVIANGALAMGRPVTMFFTFWGLTALRRQEKQRLKKSPVEKMFGMMLPRGSKALKLSKMNMAGMGTAMMRRVMQDKNIDSLEDMMKKAMENGVKIIACSMSMDVMGIREEELIDGVEIGGVGAYLGAAEEANVNLFI